MGAAPGPAKQGHRIRLRDRRQRRQGQSTLQQRRYIHRHL